MAIATGYKSNLNTLVRAANDGNLALVECTDQATGNTVITVCAMSFDGDEYTMVPLAKMFDGDPYVELYPPE